MNEDIYDKEIELYGRLGNAERVQLLAELAFDLTIDARDTYEVGTDDLVDSKRMREFNELSHRVLGQLGHEIGGSRGWSDDDFVAWIVRLGVHYRSFANTLSKFDLKSD